MFDFFIPKSKIQSHIIKEIPIETLEMIGIAQINPYCSAKFENETLMTVVNFLGDNKNYDERETLVVTEYFTKRKCPKCKKIEVVPTKIRLNFDATYLKYEEEVAWGAYSSEVSKTNSPSYAYCYCTACAGAFEVKIKNKDLWAREAKKLKKKDIVIPWQEYELENY